MQKASLLQLRPVLSKQLLYFRDTTLFLFAVSVAILVAFVLISVPKSRKSCNFDFPLSKSFPRNVETQPEPTLPGVRK